VINVAAIGLTLNPAAGLAYLVPRKNRVCLDISYMGRIALAVQVGSILWAKAAVVREKDTFIENGIGQMPTHTFETFSEKRGKIIGGYCVSKTLSNEFIVETMTLDKIYKNHRNRSEAWKAFETKKTDKPSPWHTDEEEMIKKTLVRNASKYWPKTNTSKQVEALNELEDSEDKISAPIVVDNEKRKEQFVIIEEMLLKANIDKDYYIKETLPKITRREVMMFEELTDAEIDMIMIQLNQLTGGI
jgi:recombination protein RecT